MGLSFLAGRILLPNPSFFLVRELVWRCHLPLHVGDSGILRSGLDPLSLSAISPLDTGSGKGQGARGQLSPPLFRLPPPPAGTPTPFRGLLAADPALQRLLRLCFIKATTVTCLQHSLCARHSFKHFTYIISFNPRISLWLMRAEFGLSLGGPDSGPHTCRALLCSLPGAASLALAAPSRAGPG